jgi:hypothetical protein
MHVAVGIFLAMVAGFVLIVLIGLTPFLAIPIAAFLLISPWLIGAHAANERSRGRKTDVPSTREASYEPVADPAERL